MKNERMLQIKSNNAEIGAIYLREYDELKVVSRGSSDRIYIKFVSPENIDEIYDNFYSVYMQIMKLQRLRENFTFNVGHYNNGFHLVREYTNCWISETEFSHEVGEPIIFEIAITSKNLKQVAAETISANMVATVTKGKGE